MPVGWYLMPTSAPLPSSGLKGEPVSVVPATGMNDVD
jgi:hypothetical protein